MDKPSQDHFRPFVISRLAEIENELKSGEDATKTIAPDVSIGRLSRLDSMQMQQMALAGKRRLEEQRTRLQQALRRIEEGTYGHCGLCGQPIAIERLEHQPDATVCVPCLNKRK